MTSSFPGRMQEEMDYVICGAETNIHVIVLAAGQGDEMTTSAYSAHTFSALNLDQSWDFKEFRKKFKIEITKLDEDTMELDLVGVHTSIANALRRIMIAEVPTMAIEHVFIVDNTGVVQDEILAHRLGLIPIKADARSFELKTKGEPSSERNCIVFKMEVEHKKSKSGNLKVFSNALKWMPEGSEMPEETNCRFSTDQRSVLSSNGLAAEIKPVDSDILITKLQTQQRIQLEAHCFKGIGKEHAKWSPVSTAWYRLRPEVILLKEVQGKKAEYLAENFKGLFTIESKQSSGKPVAKVLETRGREIYLEQIRQLSSDPDWESKIQVRKQKDYFLFTVESVGHYPPQDIFAEALDILIHKCDKLINAL